MVSLRRMLLLNCLSWVLLPASYSESGILLTEGVTPLTGSLTLVESSLAEIHPVFKDCLLCRAAFWSSSTIAHNPLAAGRWPLAATPASGILGLGEPSAVSYPSISHTLLEIGVPRPRGPVPRCPATHASIPADRIIAKHWTA